MDNMKNSKIANRINGWFKQDIVENALLINCFILSVIFLANCFLPVFSYFAFIYLTILLLSSDLKNGLSYIFFAFPFGGLNIPYSVILYLINVLIYVAKFMFIKVRTEHLKLKISKRTLIVLGILLAYIFIPIHAYYNVQLLIKSLCIVAVLAILYIIIKFPEDVQLKFNFRVLGIALLIASIYFAFHSVSPHMQETIDIFYISENMIRFSGLFNNPNTFALICEIGMFALAYYIMTGKADKKDLLAFVIYIALGIMTFSKTFMVIMSVVMLLMAIYAIKTHSKQAWFCVIAFILITTIIVIVVPEFVLVYLNRFGAGAGAGSTTDEIISAVTTSRSKVWKEYIKFLFANPLAILLGRGLGAPILSVYSTHNMYLGIVYQFGIVGAILLGILFALVFWDARKGNQTKISKAVFVPILCIALIAMVEDFIFYVA